MTTIRPILLAAADLRTRVGQVMGIQGIRDLVEEYLGEHRDIFRKEMVHRHAIFEGAMNMWEKKQHAMADRYVADDSSDNFDALMEVELHFIDLYEVRHGYHDECTYNQHISKLKYAVDSDEYLLHTYTQAEMENDEADYQEYLTEYLADP